MPCTNLSESSQTYSTVAEDELIQMSPINYQNYKTQTDIEVGYARTQTPVIKSVPSTCQTDTLSNHKQ